MYIRLTFRGAEVYEILEPLLKDYRKLRQRGMSECWLILVNYIALITPKDGYSLTYIDAFVYDLLTEERVCDIILPRIPKRQILEETGEIGPRKSRLLDAMEGKSDNESERSRSNSRSRSPRSGGASQRSRSGSQISVGSRYISRSRSRSRSGSGSPFRSRSPSISPDRMEV